MQGSDDSLDLRLIGSRGSGGTHVDLACSRGSHDLGDVMSAQATRHQDDDVVSPALDEAGEGVRLRDGRIPTRRQHAVVPEFHEDVEAAILIHDLVESTVEGQRRILGCVPKTRGRVHVNLPVAGNDADDKAEAHRRSTTNRREGHDIGGDAVDLLARMDKVTGTRTHEHLNATGGRHLEGGGHLIERGRQAAAGQIGADLDAIRSPIARTAHAHGIFHANLYSRHGCHLS